MLIIIEIPLAIDVKSGYFNIAQFSSRIKHKSFLMLMKYVNYSKGNPPFEKRLVDLLSKFQSPQDFESTCAGQAKIWVLIHILNQISQFANNNGWSITGSAG